MKNEMKLDIFRIGVLVLFLSLPFAAVAQDPPSACVGMGALAFDNWTKVDSGGTGVVPVGAPDKDYIRCKACHGWDRRGTEGGYARRSRKSSRPNAGAGDADLTPRAIVTGSVTADMIAHAGTGRSYDDGTGSWVDLGTMHNGGNKAAHVGGYTLGNQHPDFSAAGVNGTDLVPSQEQLDCLAEFLNFADADPAVYFANINPGTNHALYTIVDTADSDAGSIFWSNSCEGCHDSPEEFVLGYLDGDGKYSELAHKARWGSPDSDMTREAMGNPTSADIANLMLYLQGLNGTGFTITGGVAGAWADAARDGEGFLVDVALVGEEKFLIVSFYTFDSMGNQTWLIGVGAIDGDTATVNFEAPTGAMWGMNFDPADVNKTPWGTGVFTFTCESGTAVLTPNANMMGMGFTDLNYVMARITETDIACP